MTSSRCFLVVAPFLQEFHDAKKSADEEFTRLCHGRLCGGCLPRVWLIVYDYCVWLRIPAVDRSVYPMIFSFQAGLQRVSTIKDAGFRNHPPLVMEDKGIAW